MDKWFQTIVTPENPGSGELSQFSCDVESFLNFVVTESGEFNFLWIGATELRRLAQETVRKDIPRSAALLRDAIPSITGTPLDSQGLRGRALGIKVDVVAHLVKLWRLVKSTITARGLFKQLCEAVDALLNSLTRSAVQMSIVHRPGGNNLLTTVSIRLAQNIGQASPEKEIHHG